MAYSPRRRRTGCATLRLVNAADFSTRAAAPGSLDQRDGWARECGQCRCAEFSRAGGIGCRVADSGAVRSRSGQFIAGAANGGRGDSRFGLPVQAVSPAIFVNRDGSPMILDGDSGLVLDGHRGAFRIPDADPGHRVWARSGRIGRPGWPAPLENPPAVAATVKAYLDRVPVQVTHAALAPGYIGFYLD